MEKKPKKLLDRAREILRLKHYSFRTEESYIGWMYRYIIFHNKRHPKDMGAREIEEFLSYLAMDQNVAGSTQNQAFNALLFLYRNVLNISLEGEKIDALRAVKKYNLPVVMTKDEVKLVITAMSGMHQLMSRGFEGSSLPLTALTKLANRNAVSNKTSRIPQILITKYKKNSWKRWKYQCKRTDL